MTDVPEEEQVKTCGLAVNAALKGDGWQLGDIDLSVSWKVFRGGLIRNRSLTRVLTGNNPHPLHNRKGTGSSPTL